MAAAIDSATLLRFLRRAAIALLTVAIAAYLAILLLLLIYQRDMLFVRGRSGDAPDPLYRVTTVKEADDQTIKTWQALQPDRAAPVMVFFYGNAGALSDFQGIGEIFHTTGYSIVLASYRGYAGNPGSPTEVGLMQDARAVLHALPKGHGPVVLCGQSLGSGVAARMASEGRASALILISPYTAITDLAATRFSIFPVRLLMYDSFDTASLVPKIKVPVLIMSGTNDQVVPFTMSRHLAELFGKRATFVTIPGGTHNVNPIAIQSIAASWLARHRQGLR
jgi:pimeloyl-ACP methyl ester carboxylesterase